jgi:uncharacterized SAM-binding protein YcdF (DUF218 family)
LDVGEKPQAVDVVMILPGDFNTRPFVAAALFKAGLARMVVTARNRPTVDVQTGVSLPQDEITRRVVVARGVPADRFLVLSMETTSTFDDAKALAAFVDAKKVASVAVVTNDYHTRRASWVFHQVLQDRDVKIHFVSAPTDGFSADNWWQVDNGFLSYANEYAKLFFYLFYYGQGGMWVAGVCIMLAGSGVLLRRYRGAAARSVRPRLADADLSSKPNAGEPLSKRSDLARREAR